MTVIFFEKVAKGETNEIDCDTENLTEGLLLLCDSQGRKLQVEILEIICEPEEEKEFIKIKL